jgi:UrcA family protein
MAKSHGISVRWGALFVLASLFIVESAVADVPPIGVPSVRVQYQDLDLNDSKNVAVLYQRIRHAAVEVCKPAEGPQLVNHVFWTGWNECFNHAIANAVQTVHNEKLSAYHGEHVRDSKRTWVDAPVTGQR